MPKIPATALAPMAAAQSAAMVRPTAVAARMMASGAPTAVAGVTPTSARPSATEPTMKLGSPRMAGSPPSGPGTATVTASTTSSTWIPDREVPSAVIAAPLTESLRSHTVMWLLNASVPLPQTAAVLSLSRPASAEQPTARISRPTAAAGHHDRAAGHHLGHLLGRHGLTGFQQGLEAGDDLRPADADHLRHGAAWLETVVHHGQLDHLPRWLDVEGHPRAALGGQLAEEFLVPVEALGQVRRDGVPCVGQPPVGLGFEHDLSGVCDLHAVVVPGHGRPHGPVRLERRVPVALREAARRAWDTTSPTGPDRLGRVSDRPAPSHPAPSRPARSYPAAAAILAGRDPVIRR